MLNAQSYHCLDALQSSMYTRSRAGPLSNAMLCNKYIMTFIQQQDMWFLR